MGSQSLLMPRQRHSTLALLCLGFLAPAAAHDCARRPGLPPDFPALYEELNNGSYSTRLYGAPFKLPRCSQLRLLWLPLMDNETLRTLHLCGGKDMVPRPVPPRLLYFPFTYEYKDAAMVPALLDLKTPELRQPPLEPWGIPSHAWVEVTHCPVGAEGENLYFYRMPGSGLSIYTGNVLVLNKTPGHGNATNQSVYKTEHDFRGPGEAMHKRVSRVKAEGFDTIHAPQSKGLNQEILALRHDGQPLGKAGRWINGNMLVQAGHMRCGQPPAVRVCRPDEPAARLHEACPPWNSKRPGERLTEKNRPYILEQTHGIHACNKGGDNSVLEAPMTQLPRRLRDLATVIFAGFSPRGRLLGLAATTAALQPQVRSALNHWEPELLDIVSTTADCCAMISRRIASPPLREASSGGGINVQGETQTPMDVFADTLLNDALRPLVRSLASEEAEAVVAGSGDTYSVAFDPLDGSSNVAVSLPTGTIFGVFKGDAFLGTPRQNLIAAGYCLYSSSCEFVVAKAGDVRRFYLDGLVFREAGTMPATPRRGPYYSLNDAREPDWPAGLQSWIYSAKRGKTQAGTKYSSRYVCALVADVHRTLLTGGWAGNPRPHLRLLYEAAPLAFVAAACGGYASDGVQDILDVDIESIHARSPYYCGSIDDVKDLEACGDVQQTAEKYIA